MLTTKPFDLDRFVRLLITVAAFIAAYFLLDKLSSVLVPFFLAWLTAYLLDPIVRWNQRWVRKRGLAVMITLLSIAVVVVGFVMLIVPVIVEELYMLEKVISQQVNQMAWPDWIPSHLSVSLSEWLSAYDWKALLANERVTDQAATAITGVWNTVTGMFGFIWAVFGVVTYLLYLIFIMFDYEHIAKEWISLIPEKHKAWVVELVNDIELGMNGYFKAQTKIVLSVTLLFAIGFKIIGLPFGIGLGILVGLLNYIPYAQLFGIIPAIALAGLSSLEDGSNFWWILLLVLVVFVVVQLIQDLWLTPYFLGNFSGFNPAIILLSLSVWGALLGTIGIIIAIPLTSLFLAYYKRYVLKHQL